MFACALSCVEVLAVKLSHLVIREILERKASFVTALLSVAAGVALVVSVRAVLEASEADVARTMDGLGANVLVLPPNTTVADYFSADLSGSVMPESIVTTIAVADLYGVDIVSPKLSRRVRLKDGTVTMTGILPQREFAAKAAWKRAGAAAAPREGRGSSTPPAEIPETAIRRQVIESLEPDEILVGADVARRFGVGLEEPLEIEGRMFEVLEILPETGTVDDARIFAHLHVVQEMGKAGAVVNAVEIVGCCREIRNGLVTDLQELLPATRIVTVKQIVSTQVATNRTMAGLSWMLFVVALAIGGFGIFSSMSSNLRARQHELGMLGALGASSSMFLKLFGSKAVLVAVLGGLFGWAVGAGLAAQFGPRWVGVAIPWRSDLIPLSLSIALALTALAGLWPIWRATRLDPAEALRFE